MELNYHAIGCERKRLAQAISAFTGFPAKYQFMPTCAYQIGSLTLDKEGVLHCENSTDLTGLLEALAAEGFNLEKLEPEQTAAAETETATLSREVEKSAELVISLPKDDFTDASLEKLQNILTAKGSLIKKALGVDALPVEVTDDRICFPWFDRLTEPDETQAYMSFIVALCAMAKNQKRINTKERPVDNEKYAFRCFLLRLGFIGPEYKDQRRILLQKLNGSSAFKGGPGHAVSK